MRVAFNATSLLSPLTGIGQYSLQLAHGLALAKDVDADFFYGAFWNKGVRAEPMHGTQHLLPWIRTYVPHSYELRRFLQNRRFKSHTGSRKFDLYHEPNILPLPFDGTTVVTVHDLSWIRYPETHPVERVKAMEKYFHRGLKQATLLLTDSNFVKQELIDVFGITPHSICVIPLGVETIFHPYNAIETQQVLNKYQLTYGNYLLAVGTLEPRKNLELAICSFLLLPKCTRKKYPLVLAGMKGWLNSRLEQLIEPLIHAGEIHRLGYIPRAELALVVAGANLMIYPSLYEGFGLPPLESMACGVPVIASNTSSLPEVVGDAGVLIDPNNAEALTEAILTLIDDPERRSQLSKKSIQKSKEFSWEKCVDSTIKAYREAVSRN
jgi:glycosyltransferase involved in cell wall biosynthesis